MRHFRHLALVLISLAPISVAHADVSVVIGPTSIARGDAVGEKDITVSNGIFAVAFAVETAPPWGVARGGIVDIAVFRDGELGYDIASLADFMPNVWSSWPTTYQEVTLEKQTASEVVVKTVRDWGEVQLETTFCIRDGDSKIQIVTSMHNAGEVNLEGLYSGYVVWPDGGSLFSVPGLLGVNSGAEDEALANWSASYGERWMLGLHAPFSEFVAYDGRDRYLPHDLEAAETESFEAWLQIENDGTLAPLVRAEIDFLELSSGRLSGHVVSDDGKRVARPAVVVSKNGSPYAWTLGDDGAYEFVLPVGDYEVYATAAGYAQGATKTVSVSASGETRIDFDDVRPPGQIEIKVTEEDSGDGLDASISIRSGNKPLIGYFGKNRFFTELHDVGKITEEIAPGAYVFEISAGGGFTTKPQLVEVVVEPGESHALNSVIAVTASPQERGWYSADLHHHSDVLDGFTEA
ncbi:MAG: carboxypeptidase regulatory-like domain-containing protein, partial [Woeseiaceae bacterium]